MTCIRAIGLTALAVLLCLSSFTAEAKNHLSRDEIKILAAMPVAVVYMDTDRALWPYINQHIGITPATMMLADELNQRQLDAFIARTAPYQDVLGKLSFPRSNRMAMQDALASVLPLQQAPWTVVIPDLQDHSFLHEQGLKTKAQVVVFIRPRLELNDDADDLYLVTLIDIETLDATGKTLTHYDSSELSADVDVDDDALPSLTTPPQPGMSQEDLRAARLFADDGEAFKRIYAKLLLQAQQQLYYYFTGNNTPPPATTATAPAQ